MIHSLWKEGAHFPAAKELEIPESTIVQTIKKHNHKADGFGFTHGVAIVQYNGLLYASWAANREAENTQTELLRGSIFRNGVWSPAEIWLESKKEAISHGAFFVIDGTLWGFFPHFTGMREQLRTHIYQWDEKADSFQEAGLFPEAPFWPLTKPQKMSNGNYIMTGCWVGGSWNSTFNPPAVAISKGSDMLKWRVIRIPKPEDMILWGESTVVVDKNHITLISRSCDTRPVALVSVSSDCGESWSLLDASNLPMCDSKPYAGTLSTGRRYLVATTCADGGAGRYPLTIALSEPGEKEYSKVLVIRRHNPDSDRPMNIDDVMAVSYPYAIELEHKLYVTYSQAIVRKGISANDNNIELAIIPIESLR
jgi:hypothetical protein